MHVRKPKSGVFCLWGAFLVAALTVVSGCKGTPPPEPEPEVKVYSNLLSPEAEDLLRRGVGYHDRGNYETAIDYFNRAMELAPDHPVIYYEIAFTRIAMGEADAALELAEKGIASAQARKYYEVIPTLLDLKGSALYNLDRNEEAIKVYLQAINEYGANTFLYYNLAINYYSLDRREEAVETLLKGLLLNPNHASSNYLLGKICMEDGKKTQAFYALCYFLIMEPNTARATQSYNTIQYMLGNEEEGIGVRDNGSFTAADMIISVAFSLDEENIRMSDAQKMQAKLHYVFTNLEDQKNSGKISRSAGDELWWDFYSPFFYRIAKSSYMGTFSRYIGLSVDPDAEKWIENGRDEIEGFFDWLNE